MDAKPPKILLSLDLSTSCTGYAVFEIHSQKLLTFGKLKPTTKGGVNKMKYPRQQLTKMRDVALQVLEVINQYKPDAIVIEEIAGSKNRLGQKTLDGLHYIVANTIEDFLDIVRYYDVTGNAGWRTHLRLRLSDADKQSNKEAKKLNKKLSSKQKIPIIGPKHLACRYVNSQFDTALDVDKVTTDADVADAIAMGHAFLLFRFAELTQSGMV